MSKYVEELVNKWADEDTSKNCLEQRSRLRETLHMLNFLELRSYSQYEPTRPPNASYWQRMEKWLKSAEKSPADQRLMFELASHLFFVGAPEIEALHKAAYAGPIMRWLIQQGGLSIRAQTLSQSLTVLVSKTWFCPITDSMVINEFVHLNAIQNGINYRPDFFTLAKMNAISEIQKIVDENGIERLVLLEDFIGTGSQAKTAIQFASNLVSRTSKLPILVVPLILCETHRSHFCAANFKANVTLSPLLMLSRKNFVNESPAENIGQFKSFRDLAQRTFATVTDGLHSSRAQKPYHYLGYGKTGGLIVLKSNTPDNTLPLVHWSSNSWAALFPRHPRI